MTEYLAPYWESGETQLLTDYLIMVFTNLGLFWSDV